MSLIRISAVFMELSNSAMPPQDTQFAQDLLLVQVPSITACSKINGPWAYL